MEPTPRVHSHAHATHHSLADLVAERASAIRARGDLAHATVHEQLDILEGLAECAAGRFLLANQGLNGEWTHRLITHPLRPTSAPQDGIEQFLFERAPTMRATQERFVHFRAALADALPTATRLASVPCGWMADLLWLEHDGRPDVQLIGVDLDAASLAGAEALAKTTPWASQTTFLQQDAWALALPEPVDVLTSNGLNLYVDDDERVTALYARFAETLRPGGRLITSFLTPPPTAAPSSPWDLAAIDLEALRLQRIAMVDVIDAQWRSYRTEATTRDQLIAAGFRTVEIVWDQQRMFPTVIATR